MGAPQAAEPSVHPLGKTTRPSLVMVSGLPGVGKTFFSRKLAARLPGIILESDDLRKKLFPHPSYSPEENKNVFLFVHRRIAALLENGSSVILDATNLVERHRRSVYNIAEKYGTKLLIVSVEAPPDIVKKRLKDRTQHTSLAEKSDADWSVYQRMKPSVERIRLPHYRIDSTRDITPAINRILKEING